MNFWKRHYENISVARRTFMVFSKTLPSGESSKILTPEDFKPLFKYLLESHPGLEFLQATPEFQERYADTVVMRIFF